MALVSEKPVALGPFLIDGANQQLYREGIALELRPQAFRALKVLIDNRGHLVEYPQLIREAWPGLQVSKHTVAVTVNEVKDALGSYGSWITCRPKLGYLLHLPEGDDLIRRGWHFSGLYTRAGFENSLRCFFQAAERDSRNFEAFTGIAKTYLMLNAFLMRAPRSIRPAFLDAYRRAVALSGETTDLQADRAFGRLVFERQPARAAAELLGLREQNPALPFVHIRLALAYMGLGELDRAHQALRQAEAGDALRPEWMFTGTLLRIFQREFEAAVSWGKESLDLHPGSPVGRAFYAEALEHCGRLEEALSQYRLATAVSPDISWIRVQEARCLALCGRPADAMAILAQLERNRDQEYVDAYFLALLLDALGKPEEAAKELRRAQSEHSYALVFSPVDPKGDGLLSRRVRRAASTG